MVDEAFWFSNILFSLWVFHGDGGVTRVFRRDVVASFDRLLLGNTVLDDALLECVVPAVVSRARCSALPVVSGLAEKKKTF